MFHAFGVGLCCFSRNTNGQQQIDHKTMTSLHSTSEFISCSGKENAPIRARIDKTLPLETPNVFDGCRNCDSHAFGDFRGSRLAMRGEQIGDQLDIVLE